MFTKPRTQMKRTPMKKGGRRTNDWIATRRRLKAEFEARGITRCEVRLSEHCTPDNFQSFAHSRKRRFITTEAELKECVLSCFSCHQILDERMSHDEMHETVTRIIQERAT